MKPTLKGKEIEVMLKVPKDWLSTNELDIFSMFGNRIRDRVKDKLLEKATDQIMKEIKIPKIKIEPEEIKNRVLRILAEKVLKEQ